MATGPSAERVAHGVGAVDQQVGDDVGLLLVLLDDVLVGPAEHLVVEPAGVVAGDVGAVLDELDAETPAERAAVVAGQVAVDDEIARRCPGRRRG